MVVAAGRNLSYKSLTDLNWEVCMSFIRSNVAEPPIMLILATHDLGDVKVFECTGRIVFGCADILRSAILRQSRARTVLLDLGAVDAIDAAGLGVLVSLRTWATETGRTIKLMNLTPRVEELLELTHLRSVLEVCSVPQMLDLFCRAIDSAHRRVEPAVQIIGPLFDGAQLIRVEGQW